MQSLDESHDFLCDCLIKCKIVFSATAGQKSQLFPQPIDEICNLNKKNFLNKHTVKVTTISN